jgi:hypothetical protein
VDTTTPIDFKRNCTCKVAVFWRQFLKAVNSPVPLIFADARAQAKKKVASPNVFSGGGIR